VPRVSTTWSYEKSKRRYVANINKEKIILLERVDRTKANDRLADEAYAKAKAIATVQSTGDRTAIEVALGAWLAWLETRPQDPVAPNTYEQYQRIIWSFTALHGKVLGRDVTVWHIEDWLAKMQQERKHQNTGQTLKWDDGTVKLALRVMRGAFSYCTARRLITTDPFTQPDAAHLRKGSSIDYEGKRLPIEEHEYDALVRRALTRSNKDWAILCMLLWHTGARPAELLLARAEEWRPKEKTFVIEAKDPANVGRFKLRRKRKNRVIYVRDEMVPFVELLIEKYRDAPKLPANIHQILTSRKAGRPEPAPMRAVSFLFRRERNEGKRGFGGGEYGPVPMTYKNVNGRIASTARLINEEEGVEVVRPGLTAYSFRHAYVTRWIVKNKENHLKHLAQMLGTSVAMIERHYSHLFRKHDVLREVLNAFEAVDT
jgi:integrase